MEEAGIRIIAYDGLVGAKAYMHSQEWDAWLDILQFFCIGTKIIVKLRLSLRQPLYIKYP